jgi:uncharacterized Fe-S cluster-containing radical SAM superfamily protein
MSGRERERREKRERKRESGLYKGQMALKRLVCAFKCVYLWTYQQSAGIDVFISTVGLGFMVSNPSP